jgi:acetyl esterase/lipase
MKWPVLLVAILMLTAIADRALGDDANPDSSTIDQQGNAHVTRLIPVPHTISPEAQAFLAQPTPFIPHFNTLAENRAFWDLQQQAQGEALLKRYPVQITDSVIGGVPVRVISPKIAPDKRDRVLIAIHGGGDVVDSGSLTETIPIASLTHTKVIAVLYRLYPEAKRAEGTEDIVTVYRTLLKTYKPYNIGVYGASAGGALTGGMAVRARQLKLPLPGALGILAAGGDELTGDSLAMYGVVGLTDQIGVPRPEDSRDDRVPDRKDPVVSPLHADLRGFPPTLFLTSTRDLMLSGTVRYHRGFLAAGVDAQLVVFDALPHDFWGVEPWLPESAEANRIIAHFFDTHLGKRGTKH